MSLSLATIVGCEWPSEPPQDEQGGVTLVGEVILVGVIAESIDRVPTVPESANVRFQPQGNWGVVAVGTVINYLVRPVLFVHLSHSHLNRNRQYSFSVLK